jgi:hypothetical protein
MGKSFGSARSEKILNYREHREEQEKFIKIFAIKGTKRAYREG